MTRNKLTKRRVYKKNNKSRKKTYRKKYGGGSKTPSKKLRNIVQDIFSENIIEYLPSTNIFMNKLENRYVQMVNLKELRNIIDSEEFLKSSNIISNIYRNKNIINLSDIKKNVDLTIINNSLRENIILLFQHIIDYNIHNDDLFDQGYVKNNTDLYSVITCSDKYDKPYEIEVNALLTDKLFDIRDTIQLIKKTSLKLTSDKTFKNIVSSKLRECSKNPTSLFDLFTGDISFTSYKECSTPEDVLLKFNKQKLVFLDT